MELTFEEDKNFGIASLGTIPFYPTIGNHEVEEFAARLAQALAGTAVGASGRCPVGLRPCVAASGMRTYQERMPK
jgi:hypothetical protein